MHMEEKILKELLELGTYVREEVATKKELSETRAEMLEHFQDFAKLHQGLEQEQSASFARSERLEARVDSIEHRLGQA